MDKIHLYKKALKEIEKVSIESKKNNHLQDLKESNIFKKIITSEENFFEFKMNFIQGIFVIVKKKIYLIDKFILYDNENNEKIGTFKRKDFEYFISKNR